MFGMLQMVGESGWQRSHGERCRLFLARALLQLGLLTISGPAFTLVFTRVAYLLSMGQPFFF
jgi:hypothetical protein